MKKILVTGASGYVGARIYIDLQKKYNVVGTYFNNDFNENLVKIDITDLNSVRSVFNAYNPDFIVHVAAFPVSPQNDEQKKLIEKLNYKGVDNIVKVSNEIGAKVVFVSSAIALTDSSSSANDIYGQSKAYGERECKKVVTGSLIVRPHTVFGYSPNMTNDRSFNRILKNIFLKTPAIYDNSWKFEPTYIGHISGVIDKYILGDIKANIMNVAFDTLKSKYDLGFDILNNFGIEVTPVDNKSTWAVTKLDLTDFYKLNLHVKSYNEMISTMVEEIKQIGDNYPKS
jgi:dTDP-4-dehydrorhamnose reductase